MFRGIGMSYYSSLDEAFPNKKKSNKDINVSLNDYKKGQQRTDMLGERERVSYRSQLSDYDYVCKTTGVCPLEEFTNSEEEKKCEPIQPPKYEYPINDKDKEKFRKALKIALEQMEDKPIPQEEINMQNKLKNMKPPPSIFQTPDYSKPIAKNNISGFFDEELENYLNMNDFKDIHANKYSTPQELPEKPAAPPVAKPKPVAKAETAKPAVKQEVNYTKKNKMLMNLLLFISGGILFIFLLEQLYRLAIYNGLKKTVESLEYIITEVKGTTSS